MSLSLASSMKPRLSRAALAARAIAWLAIVGAAALGACSSSSREQTTSTSSAPDEAPSNAPASASASSAAAASGEALVARFQCVRCHDGTGAAEVALDKHCVRCHLDIGDGKFEAPPTVLASWKPHVMHLRFTPSLSGIGRLVKPEWAAKFVTRPFDVRPSLHPQMPRLALDDIDARAIMDHLATRGGGAELPSQPLTGDLKRGRDLFETKSCVSCHSFTGSGTPQPRAVPPGRALRDRALAPDLRFARERLVAEHVAAYIRDPTSVKPDAAMPKPGVTEEEAMDLATFVLQSPLDQAPRPAPPTRLAVLERPVTYDEVAEKVLHKICWHCHSQPDYARGDGGPGNTGGFGFAGRKLDLSSYESIAAGYLDDAGERRSLFTKGPGGEPILVESLLARQREELGEIAASRGMPLGLPALSAEDIQLVETWVAQGHPR